ncbi:thiol reductant ABC exporter subunit CydC [Microbacterium sp. EYE_5]|uniref:thiol reductant ABC exporter subunit CydC n=1 Tax=unclassified Microbacterium TaxID=2609290 RepID=UPI002002D1DA|nr:MULTISPECIES: thiol reductant ABC exporter subunit CydC [unclassified Microbacterium]MCK6080293.1 thiol reductant ABC exporter subunit CydC [Microbacterium sp. EYE_382]MCK6085564.1 thiol reductant ABC exporter subunit CydC [Microbacterium sp. EYE_384]MCK6122211.1 thiol reductant ABC exporter subunit CydC [Microbacterium sp. EYE_80]MCK6126327.1 thiol reductant ABC exporter subunit CydC [Microbacterium sp. EYE_79]MCK6141248.1 thiol reductant ABC exporter subunit CydC [Microbacterium sp. EYE_3
MSAASDVLRAALPAPRRIWPALASGFLSEASAIALLAVSAWLIVRASEQPLVLYITLAVVGVRAFALSRAVFRYTERLAGHDAVLHRLADTRAGLVRRLIPHAPAGLARTSRGDATTALVDDVDELQNLALRVVQPLVSSATVAVGAVVLVALVWWPAALTLVGCLVVAAVAASAWGWAAGARAEHAIAPRRARVRATLQDHLSALDVLVAYGAEGESRERVRVADAELRAAVLRRAGAQAGTAAVVALVAGAATLLALVVSAPALATGGLPGPGLAVAVLVPMAVFEVFASVPAAASAWRQVRSSADRIAAVVPRTVPAEIPAAGSPTGGAPPLGDGLRLRGVEARWPGDRHPRLRGVDLDVRPGERVLLVGASGAGKTTLAHALVRFLEVGGEYTIGGRDVREIAPDDLRRTVGLCEQHPMLFDEDIRHNLLFARDTATDGELEAVLDRVGLGAWLRERGGLDARVGERGALVSGGQAQRISLARALLRGFPVLVLDEPTAGVDPAASDTLLADLLSAVDGERAVVVISHVQVPAALVDRTVRLDGGRIVE